MYLGNKIFHAVVGFMCVRCTRLVHANLLTQRWRRIGEELEEDWWRIGGGLEEDLRGIGGGLEEDWKRIGERLEGDWKVQLNMHCNRTAAVYEVWACAENKNIFIFLQKHHHLTIWTFPIPFCTKCGSLSGSLSGP